jgi:tRNA(fMet)-specific endonuclease VapC
MARLVLDSSVLIELDRGNSSPISALEMGDKLVLPVVVLAELLVSLKLPQRGEASRLTTKRFIQSLVESSEISVIDEEVAEVFAELKAFTIAAGVPRGANDLWIAASSIVARAELVTLDRRARFEGLPGLVLRD